MCRPQSNGSIELYHRFLKDYFKCYKGPWEWDQVIKFVAFAYNVFNHSSSKLSPYEILYGRTCNFPGQIQRKPEVLYNLNDYVLQTRWQFQDVWKKAQDNLNKTIEKVMKESEYLWVPGDLVLWKNPKILKDKEPWDGPYEVEQVNGKNVHIVKIWVATRSKRKVVHEAQLKKYKCY